jgi:hypothetical protein
MKKQIALFTLLFIFINAFAQKVNTRWSKVSKNEWQLEQCSYDTTASAVILFDVGRLYFRGSIAIIERHRRIKILDKSGLDYANVVLSYVHQNGLESVRDVSAQTINLVNGKTKTLEVNKNNIFDEEMDEYWAQVRFTLPSVAPGSIIEYKYSFSTENLYFIKPWFFQNEIPTLWSELRVEPSQNLSYNIVKFGKQLRKTSNTENRWALRDLPSYKSASFVFHPEDYAEQIHFQLLSYEKWKGPIRGGGLETINVLRDWDELGEEVLGRFGYYFNHRKDITDITQTLTADAKTDEESVQRIYDYVVKNYKWNDYWSIQPGQTFNQLSKNQSGNSAEINLMLIAMLKAAGITADPVLVSTRHHGKVVESFPLLSQFNNLIARVELEGAPHFLDAALVHETRPFHLLPRENLNLRGFLVRKEAHEWISIKPSPESQVTSVLKLDLANRTGELAYRFKGYSAIIARERLQEAGAAYTPFEQNPEIGDQLIAIKKPEIHSAPDAESLELSFEFDLPASEQELIYFSPLSWSRFTEVPFKAKERYFPLELDFPFTDNLSIAIVLPEGFQPENLPENVNMMLPNQAARFIYNANHLSNQINITMRMGLKQTLFSAETYPLVKQLYEEINNKLSEPIVIKKP